MINKFPGTRWLVELARPQTIVYFEVLEFF
jgi:hypothetical protein